MMDYSIVVYDELPIYCNKCNFYDDEYHICWATENKKEPEEDGWDKPIRVPQWCPLSVMVSIFDSPRFVEDKRDWGDVIISDNQVEKGHSPTLYSKGSE